MTTISSKLLLPHKNILHAVSTRLNGHSLYENNLAYHVNDRKEDVILNHKELAEYLQYPLDELVHMNQVHGNEVLCIDESHDFTKVPECDAVITNKKNIPLMVMVADCIPILIYDPIKKVVGAVHAGRTGIFSKILPETIKTMRNKYRCAPEEILIYLGPSIHQSCYEVGEDIKDETEKNEYGYAIKINEGHYYLDLLSIAHQQLHDIGIKKENIETSNYCTACNTDKFYSYRAEKNQCGRFAGVIMLK